MLAFLSSLSSKALLLEEKWQLSHLWKVPNNLKPFQKNPPKQLHEKKAIWSSTHRWIMSLGIYCYKMLVFLNQEVALHPSTPKEKKLLGNRNSKLNCSGTSTTLQYHHQLSIINFFAIISFLKTLMICSETSNCKDSVWAEACQFSIQSILKICFQNGFDILLQFSPLSLQNIQIC